MEATATNATQPAPKLSLHDIVERINAVLSIAADGDGVIADVLAVELDALNLSLAQKVDAYAAVIRESKASASAARSVAEHYATRAGTFDSRAEHIKTRLEHEMRALGAKKIEGETATAAFQKNPPSVKVTDEAKVPTQYMVAPPAKPAISVIRDVLKAGGAVEGCELVQGESLRIR